MTDESRVSTVTDHVAGSWVSWYGTLALGIAVVVRAIDLGHTVMRPGTELSPRVLIGLLCYALAGVGAGLSLLFVLVETGRRAQKQASRPPGWSVDRFLITWALMVALILLMGLDALTVAPGEVAELTAWEALGAAGFGFVLAVCALEILARCRDAAARARCASHA